MTDEVLAELRSIKKGIYYLAGQLNDKKGGAKEYAAMRKAGFKDEEIALMFQINPVSIRTSISQAKPQGKKHGN